MKIKQFFIDNKSKIKKVLQWFLIAVLFFVGSHLIYACGYYTRDKLDISEEANKKELVYRKEANNSIDDFNFIISKSLSDEISLFEVSYGSPEGDLLVKFFSNVSLTDYGFSFNYGFALGFPNGADYYTGFDNTEITFDDLDPFFNPIDSNSDITLFFSNSGYTLPFAPEGSDGLTWQFSLEVEFIYIDSECDLSAYFEPVISVDILELVADDYWLDTNDGWIRYFSAIHDYDDCELLKEGIFYSGSNPYYFYNSVYDNAFDVGYQEGQPKNIFYYDLENDSPYLLVFDDISYIRPDDYDENLLFKNNYLDLQYLRNLYSGQYSKFRIIFTDSIYSLKDLYLSLDNSSLNDYNILVNGKAYSINSSGTLNIPSSELLQIMEFDSALLDSTRLVNSSPDFANGFNSGYENGYQNGYDEGVDEEETRYEELILPAVKVEYEQIGFDKGYQKGKNDTLNDGSGVALFDAFTLIGKGFEAWNPILNIQVLPGMSLGVFIAIPIIIAVVMIVIKLLQR